MAIASLLLLLLLASLLHSCATVAGQDRGAGIDAIEADVRDRAFALLRRTNQLVDVPLPAVAGAGAIEAWALRLRSNALWADGVNATAGITIPPRVIAAPFAHRVTIVFERFVGGSSASSSGAALFTAPRGYALAAPVIGLLAYDASGPNGKLALRAFGAPVRVEFKDSLSSAKGFNATAARCVAFGANGMAVSTHGMASGATSCAVSGTGHYGVVVHMETPALPRPPPPPSPATVSERWWPVWTVGAGAGAVVGVSFLAVSVAAAVRWGRRRRREEMERRAMAGEELGRMAVRGSSMPSAKMARTLPELEEGSPLPWRKY